MLFALCILANAIPLHADDVFSISGRLDLHGVYAIDPDSVKEDPSLTARMQLDAQKSQWRVHSWIEGGWDGTVRSPRRDHSILKSFDEVYQDNTPYLEFKELYVERSLASLDLRVGIQRFSWGRLDEYPVNDLFNPWDYTQFIVRPIEERKIGVPSISATMGRMDWTYQLVWVPWLVPYRLPKPNERWSVISAGTALSNIPDAEVILQEPDLPSRTLGNGSAGFRIQRMGEIEWAVNLFHGYDPRPVFKTTALRVMESQAGLVIDPGFVPSFHKITSIGLDGAAVKGDWSLRGEAAYTLSRAFDIRQELWGYPDVLVPGVTPLNPVEIERDTIDYGIAADYRLIEDCMLTLQAQQTVIVDRPATLFEREIETILLANLRVQWMNQKIETNLNLAYNPEHGASMVRPSMYYVFNDSWKAGIIGLLLDGPPQSIFGRYAKNDQIEMVMVYSW
ncbi:MAG: hypothetical protein HY881_22650 [Deltaproteobacteria bacterium]|nr:hypothetical protein [Deltaproteobacteria bacterium]